MIVLTSEDILKLLFSIVAGGLIGIEREYRDKAAGFRTLIFICVGSTLLTILSVKIANSADTTRIAANIVSGIGFLGAGVILSREGRITGLTTAATIWLTAALGMGVGAGQYSLVGVTVLLSLLVLWAFPKLEKWINSMREERVYEITTGLDLAKQAGLEALFQESGLRCWKHRRVKTGDRMQITWQASGKPEAHERFMEALFKDEEVQEFRS